MEYEKLQPTIWKTNLESLCSVRRLKISFGIQIGRNFKKPNKDIYIKPHRM